MDQSMPVNETPEEFMARYYEAFEQAQADLLATGEHTFTNGPVPFTIRIVTDPDGHTRLVTEYPDR